MHTLPSMSIPTLLNICLDFVSDNPYSLSPVVCVTSNTELPSNGSEQFNKPCNNSVSENMTFRSDIFFPENIAEKLITLLSRKGNLNDRTMKLFKRETTRLKRVDIPNASEISKSGLLKMKDHKLVEIAVFGLKLPMNDVIECLSEYNLENLQTLNFSKYPPREDLEELA